MVILKMTPGAPEGQGDKTVRPVKDEAFCRGHVAWNMPRGVSLQAWLQLPPGPALPGKQGTRSLVGMDSPASEVLLWTHTRASRLAWWPGGPGVKMDSGRSRWGQQGKRGNTGVGSWGSAPHESLRVSDLPEG